MSHAARAFVVDGVHAHDVGQVLAQFYATALPAGLPATIDTPAATGW